MPTSESAAAFKKLADARAALTDMTKLLNDAHSTMFGSAVELQRYRDLQKQWDTLYQKFRVATEDFAAIVEQIHRPE